MARNFITASAQHIDFPDLNSLLGTSYSICSRLKIPSVTSSLSRQISVHRRATTSSTAIYWSFVVNPTGFLSILIRTDNVVLITDTHTAVYTINTWHTGCFTRTPTTLTTFVNGVASAGTAAGGLGTIAINDAFQIGSANVPNPPGPDTNFFEGELAEIGIWNVTLTQSEITSYDKGMSPLLIRPQNLIFYAPLWGTAQEPDLSGSGNIGTLVNAPAIAGFHSPTGLFKRRVPAENLKEVLIIPDVPTNIELNLGPI